MLELAIPELLRAHGVVLRAWGDDDVDTLIALYDTAEMDRRTPVAHPFDRAAALAYVKSAHRARRELGALQLAITEDCVRPLGEVLLFPTEPAGTVELAYAVAAEHQGRGLASRAVAAMLTLAADAGLTHARLLIAPDNPGSQRVASANGFVQTEKPLVVRRRKGTAVTLATWERPLTT